MVKPEQPTTPQSALDAAREQVLIAAEAFTGIAAAALGAQVTLAEAEPSSRAEVAPEAAKELFRELNDVAVHWMARQQALLTP